jgi:hypothetical protein
MIDHFDNDAMTNVKLKCGFGYGIQKTGEMKVAGNNFTQIYISILDYASVCAKIIKEEHS